MLLELYRRQRRQRVGRPTRRPSRCIVPYRCVAGHLQRCHRRHRQRHTLALTLTPRSSPRSTSGRQAFGRAEQRQGVRCGRAEQRQGVRRGRPGSRSVVRGRLRSGGDHALLRVAAGQSRSAPAAAAACLGADLDLCTAVLLAARLHMYSGNDDSNVPVSGRTSCDSTMALSRPCPRAA